MNLPGSILRKAGMQGREWIFVALSLLIALGIWLIVNMSDTYVRAVSVPVTAAGNIGGYASRSSSPSVVMARCRATGYDFVNLRRTRQSVVVEFAASDLHHKDGEVFYVTSNELMRYGNAIFGDNMNLETVLTDTLYFRFHRENFKKVPVQPVCSVEYAPQYTSAKGVQMIPDSVLVYGEPFHLESIERAYTKPFVLRGLKDPARGVIRLEQTKEVRLSQDEVEYKVDVERYVEISTTVQVRTRNVPSGRTLTVYPSTAKVTYRCSFPVLSDPVGNVGFYIDYKDFASSISGKCLPRRDVLPRGVLSYRIEPEVFECVEGLR